MKIRTLLATALLSFASLASAATFNLFQPASGILVGNPSTYVTTAATSSHVIALWSGTCDATTFLRGDGTCAAAGGAFPILAPDGDATDPSYSWASETNTGAYFDGSAMAFSVQGNDDYLYLDPTELYIDVNTEINGSLRATSYSAPGVGDTIITNGTDVVIETFATERLRIDTNGAWTLGADGVGSATQVLTSNGAGGPPTWETPAAGGSVANPTGTIGLTAVNGVATSAIRSDGAPALSQAIAPTWTAQHIFATTSSSEKMSLRGTDSTGDGYIAFRDNTGATRRGYVGLGSASTNDMFLANDTVNTDTHITTPLGSGQVKVNTYPIGNDATGNFNTSGAGCTLGLYPQHRFTGCSRTGVGSYVVSWALSMSGTPICMASLVSGPGMISANGNNGFGCTVSTWNAAGALVDGLSFNVVAYATP